MTERRLSAIMATDVVGYSRLMGANEVATLTSLREHRDELIDPCIASHQGRIVKLTGDGMLVEFASVVSAVDCAVDIQRDMRVRNADVPVERRIEFRIGINLGDVIVDGDDIFGDGVNVASRIEGVAKPGGVSVSGNVRENVGNKLDLEFEDSGEQELKNIAFPVRVFSIVIGSGGARKAAGASEPQSDADKPSIAVLPFNNMSDDRSQEFFSDGITEDIITDLSKISGLFVVGRNTSFTYKGKSVQLQQVAAELGVKYLLEGSVRKAGERVRVTGQLIDGTSGGHLWADRYDRDLTDIFAIQDEITQAIVEQLKIKLLPKEKKAIAQAPTVNVEAYTYYLKGRQFLNNSTKVLIRLARQMFMKAIDLDPNYARAYAGVALSDARLSNSYRVAIPTEGILAMADKAIALDPQLPEAYSSRGVALGVMGRHADAIASFEQALVLDPNSADAHFAYARYLVPTGNLAKALEHFERATALDPDDWLSPLLAEPLFITLGRTAEGDRCGWMGIKRAEEAMMLHPENGRPAQLGAPTLARLGETERAVEWLERSMMLDPDDPIVAYNAACTYAQLGDLDRMFAALERWSAESGIEQELWLETDNDFDSVRQNPDFVTLCERVKQRRVVRA